MIQQMTGGIHSGTCFWKLSESHPRNAGSVQRKSQSCRKSCQFQVNRCLCKRVPECLYGDCLLDVSPCNYKVIICHGWGFLQWLSSSASKGAPPKTHNLSYFLRWYYNLILQRYKVQQISTPQMIVHNHNFEWIVKLLQRRQNLRKLRDE